MGRQVAQHFNRLMMVALGVSIVTVKLSVALSASLRGIFHSVCCIKIQCRVFIYFRINLEN
jgi:hypothetical protein